MQTVMTTAPAKKRKQHSGKQAEIKKREAEIIRIAENIFQTEGFAFAKTELIAREAGVSVGSVYNIFSSKEKLYAAVLERIGNELVEQVTRIKRIHCPLKALEKLVMLRLTEYRRHSLFMAVFSLAYAGKESLAGTGGGELHRKIYHEYIAQVGEIIRKGVNDNVFVPVNPFSAAISFEGVLNAFVNHCLDSDSFRESGNELGSLKNTIIDALRLKRNANDMARNDNPPDVPVREVFITKYDYTRLKELIDVAQMFDSGDFEAPLRQLDNALNSGRIVNSEDVPGEVVTMNSKLRLINHSSGETGVVQLMFPADASGVDNAISILTPLGTVLLGQWKGAELELTRNGGIVRYTIEELLYQPEQAGDFHL